MIDIKSLTLGEVARIEDLSGLSISDIANDTKPKGKALAAIAFIVKRREELAAGQKPSFTWNQAQDLTFDQASELLGLGDDEDGDAEAEGAEDPKDD